MRSGVLDGLTVDDVGATCLVTGAAGFAGRHLVQALLSLGCRVRVLDLAPAPGAGLQSFRGDVRDESLVRAAVQGVDTVFHAVLTRPEHADDTARVRMVNAGGTATLVAAAKRAEVGRFVHISCADVVGDRDLLEADESSSYAKTWLDPVAESVAAAEREVLGSHGVLKTIAVRPAGLWGPEEGGPVVHKLLTEIAEGRFVAIRDDRSLADRTHVFNLVRGALLAARALAHDPTIVGGMPYFITDDERMNALEWCRPIVEGIGETWPTARLPRGFAYGAAWALEVVHRLGGPRPSMTRQQVVSYTRSASFNLERARRDLGYAPLYGRADLDGYIEGYEVRLRALRR